MRATRKKRASDWHHVIRTPTYFVIFLSGLLCGELIFGVLDAVSLGAVNLDRLSLDTLILAFSFLLITSLIATLRINQLQREKRKGEAFQKQTLEDLRRALSDPKSGEIEVYYQPKISLISGALQGVEALVRWHHPDRGLVQPLEFVRIAENTDLIHQLTRRVVSLAFAQQSKWDRAGVKIDMSINVSSKNLVDPGLARYVSDQALKHGIVSRRITLEVTENAVVADPVETSWALRELRDRGFLLAIGDFGTGYSSLTSLQTMPFTCVKLDRTSLKAINSDPQSQRLIKSITSMTRDLQLHTVAVGIEDMDTLKELRKFGVNAGQGYLFSRPLPGDQLVEWKENWDSSWQHYETAISLQEFTKECSSEAAHGRRNEELVSLCYISHLAHSLDPSQKREIARVSIEHNSSNSISGLLLLAGNTAIQVLEGSKSSVDRLYERILKDPRHSDVHLVDHSTILGRSFGKWEMKLCDLTVHQVSQVLGQSWSPATFHTELKKGDRALQLLSVVYAETTNRKWDGNNTASEQHALLWQDSRAS